MSLENIKVELKKTYNKGAVGGTFDEFHVGHERLLIFAAKMCKKVIVGVTSDEFVKKYKSHDIESFNIRVEIIKRFLENLKEESCFEVIKIENKYGPTIEDPKLEAIFVTMDTVESAFEINKIRREKGFKALEIIIVPMVFAENGGFVSSSRIRSGEIDRNGKKLITDNKLT
ncbi:MAG: pantetheine-phosphate adenylyltransferase [Candidatus Brockarchaeota archaeon]|nr:pantetheine-phosphate adenylyltransferase [Candidatus Brockarchaeota archaeon]MBO3768444.1 pantetheine-phosphate adenylyltransferase [Candidatus Brockarchaeota archaeon]MBO3801542.1 pantetheine-phosphate adenylyltransferase [Candidatus Brockarchaeota archaeon]